MPEAATRYLFGPFEANLRRHALLRDGRIVPLSPRAFELLVALLERPDRTVSRNRLLDRLWPDRVVGESSLTQAVFVLRKALDDNPDSPRFIQTVPRGGYRFIAPVLALADEHGEQSHSVGGPDSGRGSGNSETPRSILSAKAWMASAFGVVPRGLRMSVGALALAGLAFAGVAVFVPSLQLPLFEARPAQPKPSRSLSVLPFAVTDPDSELHLLAISLNDLLVTRLGAQSRLLLVKPPPALTSEASLQMLRSSAEAAQLDYLLGGSLRHGATRGDARGNASGNSRGQARLKLTLYELDDAGMLRTIPLQGFDIPFPGNDGGDLERFVATRDGIIMSLLRALSPAIRIEFADRDFDQATTPENAEAYRLYLRALHDVRGATCSGQKAMARLQSSLELDPGFAPAWDVLGWAHYNMVVFCGGHASHYANALESADRALELAPRLARSIALKATVLIETGRAGEAYALLSESRRTLPWRTDIEFLTAYALRYAGYLDEAAHILDQVFARDPVFMSVEGWTPNTLLYQRRLDAFLNWLPATDAPIFLYYRALTRIMQGRPDDARRVLESGSEGNPNDPFARLSEALAAILAEDRIRALVLLDGLKLHRERQAIRDGEFTFKIAQLYALADDPDAAFDQLRLAVEQGFFNAPYLQQDWAFEHFRDDPRFRKILRIAKARRAEFGQRFALAEAPETNIAKAHQNRIKPGEQRR